MRTAAACRRVLATMAVLAAMAGLALSGAAPTASASTVATPGLNRAALPSGLSGASAPSAPSDASTDAATASAGPLRPAIALAQSVLKVEARRLQGGYALGSAVVVAPGELVTNCHVTAQATELHVLHGGLRHRVRAQAADPAHDLCLLQAPGLPAEPVVIGRSRTLHPGDPVLAVGYTGGLALQATDGEVVALHRLDDGQVVQSSNGFSSGASGGALFDRAQRLVGVLTFRLRGGAAHYFAAPVEWLDRLRQQPAHPVAPLARPDPPFWQQAPGEQPRFLQGLRLQQDGRWPDLVALAADWLHRDADDPQAWYLGGLALHEMGRNPDARLALRCALRLEPGLRDAARLLARLALGDTPSAQPRQPAAPGPCSTVGWS